ncbi:hypothetical protein [Devosia alba]|uniref:hypothetical protein n=1 Tax=Devosia alba TaxID=3152360 RepID=UPI003263AFBE
MTTIVAKAFCDRVEILSDGGVLNVTSGSYPLIKTINKVRGSIFAPLAIAGTGPVGYSDQVAGAVVNWSRQTGSVDATIGLARQELKRQRLEGRPPLQPTRMLIAGISETKGPRLWEFVNHLGTTPEPWCLAEHGPCIRLFGSVPTEAEVAMIDEATTLASLVPMMDAFRTRFRRQCNSHVDLTIIHQYGVETRRLHVWPDDVIGSPMWTPEDWLAAQNSGHTA